MFKLKINKNQKISEIQIVEILFCLFPLTFIIGNLAVSINLVLFILSAFYLIRKRNLAFRFNNSSWLLIIFFLYFFMSTTVQFLVPGILNNKLQNIELEVNPILKSFMLLRFSLLIFVIDTLFFNKILDLKKFFLSSLICTSFVSIDIIIKYIAGVDIFGNKNFATWNSGPFGDELIAGTYLKNFSFFSFFYIFLIYKNENLKKPLLIFIIALNLIAAVLAGNRMPMILFLFGCFIIILLVKNFRLVMSTSLLIFFSVFILISSNDANLKQNYARFLGDISILNLIKIEDWVGNAPKTQTAEEENLFYEDEMEKPSQPRDIVFLRISGHFRVFQTAIEMWKERPLTGFGLKSFRIKCWDILEKDNIKRKVTKKPQYLSCGHHPHNYYLEFLSEAGIIGTCLLLGFFLILFKDSFYYLRKFNKQMNAEMCLLIPVIILFFLEIWPIRSSGSFFTTWGATFFWINAGILMSAVSKKN